MAKRGKKTVRPAKNAGAAKPAKAAGGGPDRKAFARQLVAEMTKRNKAAAAESAARKKAFMKAVKSAATPAQAARAGGPMLAGGPVGGGLLQVLAEGDSWFDYPLEAGGIVAHLDSVPGLRVFSLAKAGDEAQNMLRTEQRKRLISTLKDDDFSFEAILFSGGGNDIVGDELAALLTDNTAGSSNPADALKQPHFSVAIDRVRSAYLDLIAIRDEHAPNAVIFANGYGFLEPTGKGVLCLGPWLEPALSRRGWINVGFEVVKLMLESFHQMLRDLAAVPAHKLRLVPTFDAIDRQKKWWANEIHPTPAGFDRVTAKFVDALRAEFPGRL